MINVKTNKDVARIYYDFMNQQQLLDRLKVNGLGISFKNLINFLETRIAQFSYEGLEENLPSYVLRTALMFNNKLCFYNSKTFGIVLCRYLPLGEYDFYWRPTKVQLLALNGTMIANKVDFKDIVLVKDNKLDIPPFLWLMEYFSELHNVENTLNKVLDVLKLPCTFVGNEKTVTSFKTLVKKALNFEPFAVVDKQAVDAFNQFNIDMPVKLDEYISVYKNYKNMALESIGISGTETQKRERLLVGEVESQSEYKNLTYTDFKREQNKWIDACNKKFGTKFKLVETLVEYQDTELDRRIEEAERTAEAENTGGDNNERNV